MMLLSLGVGSMIGTLEGALTAIHDMNLFIWMKKWMLAAIICIISLLVGMVFVTRAGEYWVKVFDSYGATFGLILVAFFEIISVTYVYGINQFSNDLETMVGKKPGLYWNMTWRFFSPAIMVVVFVASIISISLNQMTYSAYNTTMAMVEEKPYPVSVVVFSVLLALSSCIPIPLVAVLRFFNIMKVESNIPVSVKRLNTTQSTAAIVGGENTFEYYDDDLEENY
ncbi:PREDICTED: sodium-dependent neutral amino acid transporter B(0)AT2-like [Priapulus caudatus]|uniref:Sodium-dependent neutral amino acid transporter B(0)AT2-like n=1 Tax=Priapulus caudatus TaxID=37621 RepID=A0ABM1DSS3_PRICU|nr:PREDICTED: sodium-dependent neutral amino acid transporter B(0)AT2-like [Priapulus caudatus]